MVFYTHLFQKIFGGFWTVHVIYCIYKQMVMAIYGTAFYDLNRLVGVHVQLLVYHQGNNYTVAMFLGWLNLVAKELSSCIHEKP